MLRSNIHSRAFHGIRLMLGLRLKASVCLASFPFPPSFPNLLTGFSGEHLLHKPHGHQGLSQGLPLGKDTGFAVRRCLPTASVCGSRWWGKARADGAAASRGAEGSRGNAKKSIRCLVEKVSSICPSKDLEGM